MAQLEVRREGDNLVAHLAMAPDVLDKLDVECSGTTLRVSTTGLDVSTSLPCTVDGDAAQARYQKKKQLLTVTMPIVDPAAAGPPEPLRSAEGGGPVMEDFTPGTPVAVHGLKSAPELNDVRGVVKTIQGDRVGVVLPHPHGTKALKPGNLRILSGPEAEPEPLGLAVEDTATVSVGPEELRRLCKNSLFLSWYDGKAHWCGRTAQVVACDLRDRSVQLRHGPSLCWFPVSAVQKKGSAPPGGGGAAVGGD
eukprot:TRINITY_DN72337_c0_g1_i1.p1 TRINITY_DN72337_c0_g1~~TRINITY_DN72337_c0_g1_i1.p1  ORF type:complete len:251 (+),score=54.47 TRINITY_DN72337_c0_g1_i1:93-845(+)